MTPDPARLAAARAWADELAEVLTSTGRHQDHTLRNTDRVWCTCGWHFEGLTVIRGVP